MTERKDEAVGNINIFPQTYKEKNIRLKLQYINLLYTEKLTSMASAISDNVNKHVTTSELWAFHLRGCEHHKRGRRSYGLFSGTR